MSWADRGQAGMLDAGKPAGMWGWVALGFVRALYQVGVSSLTQSGVWVWFTSMREDGHIGLER